MEQKRPVTPEKQLLGLIENSKSKDASVEKKALKYKSLSFFSPGAWLGRLAFFKNRLEKDASSARFDWFDIRVLNNGLIVCLGVLTLYFIGSFAASLSGMNRFPKTALKAQEDIKLSIFPDIEPLRTAAYLDKIRQRDIFKIGSRPVAAKKDDGPKVSTSTAIDAIKNLKLVGISWSKDPDAMIEDMESMRTFFVKRGRMIGDVRVQDIFKDKVILNYEGQEVELK